MSHGRSCLCVGEAGVRYRIFEAEGITKVSEGGLAAVC